MSCEVSLQNWRGAAVVGRCRAGAAGTRWRPRGASSGCVKRGGLVVARGGSWGCVHLTLWVAVRLGHRVTGASWYQLEKGAQKSVGLLMFLLQWFLCCITCIDAERTAHWLPVNYVLLIINKPLQSRFGLNCMNRAAFSCGRSQMLLENDLSECIEIQYNVKKDMLLYFSH